MGHKGLQVDAPDLWQAVHVVVIPEEVQKIAGEPGVLPDGRGGESAYPFEVLAIGVNQPFRGCGWR